MQRLYAISLLSLFLLNVIGGITLLRLHRNRRHEYVEELLHHELADQFLTQVIIKQTALKDIEWEKPDREFRHKGEMYDVVRTSILPNGDRIFHCIQDHQETRLVKQIERNLGFPTSGHHGDRDVVINIFKFLFQALIPTSKAGDGQLAIQKCKTPYSFSFEQVTLSSPGQPPDFSHTFSCS